MRLTAAAGYLLRGLIAVAGAIPATLLAILAVFPGILGAAAIPESPGAVLFVLWALLAWAGTYGLWAAAIGPQPIGKSTAICLGCGIVAIAVAVPAVVLPDEQSLDLIGTAFLFGPVGVAVWQILAWRKAWT